MSTLHLCLGVRQSPFTAVDTVLKPQQELQTRRPLEAEGLGELMSDPDPKAAGRIVESGAMVPADFQVVPCLVKRTTLPARLSTRGAPTSASVPSSRTATPIEPLAPGVGGVRRASSLHLAPAERKTKACPGRNRVESRGAVVPPGAPTSARS